MINISAKHFSFM